MTRSSYANYFKPPTQDKPLRDDQVLNNTGAFVWKVDPWKQAERFLIMGSSGGTYYVHEEKLTKDNAKAVLWCMSEDPNRLFTLVEEISDQGRAPKNDQAIFTLVLGLSHTDLLVRKRAEQAFDTVVRTGFHFIQWKQLLKEAGKNGRIIHRLSQRWFTDLKAKKLAYQAIKYQQREGWRLGDILSLARPTPPTESHNIVFHWMKKGWTNVGKEPHPNSDVVQIWAFERAKRAKNEKEVVKLINDYKLPREAIPTEFLNSKAVWEALLQDMPLGAMLRNLPKMTAIGLLSPFSSAVQTVCDRLTDHDHLKGARIHPVALLNVLRMYGSGGNYQGLCDRSQWYNPKAKGLKFEQIRNSEQKWSADRKILDALDAAFYLSFSFLEPSNKRMMLALDVSASMNWHSFAGVVGLTPRIASAGLLMATAKTEPNYFVTAFASGIVPLPSISPRQRLDDIIKFITQLPATSTDCSLPMVYAMQNKIPIDCFVIYTDNETNANRSLHPATALKQYRQASGINAKLLVVAMQLNNFSIADPNDIGMLDIAGFDTTTPAVISDFAGS